MCNRNPMLKLKTFPGPCIQLNICLLMAVIDNPKVSTYSTLGVHTQTKLHKILYNYCNVTKLLHRLVYTNNIFIEFRVYVQTRKTLQLTCMWQYLHCLNFQHFLTCIFQQYSYFHNLCALIITLMNLTLKISMLIILFICFN